MGKRCVDIMRPRHLDLRPENEGGDDDEEAQAAVPVSLPPNMELFSNQVAGHMQDGVNLGLIKSNTKVYKPITKEVLGRREINLYEELNNTRDTMLLELKRYVPRYYGTEMLTVNGKEVKYIVLDDITKDFKEPCVMDIKIGRKTHDPLASYEKIVKENNKYRETKRDLAFCIPGFQVFKISNGRICKYGKDYGKSLTKDTVRDALKIFLNADSGLSRTLIMQILTYLWRIANWARKQRQVRLFSSSLLLVYDAGKLRQNLNSDKQQLPVGEGGAPRAGPSLERMHSLNRPLSIALSERAELAASGSGFSGLLTGDGPILAGPASPTRLKQFSPLADRKAGPPSLKRMHSFQNNYDNELQRMKADYSDILDRLVNSRQNLTWATVKIIDFAHVFPAENCNQDTNFLEGVENLVKLFECFMMETDPGMTDGASRSDGSGGGR